MTLLPNSDRTALSHWFPLIQAAGLPVPRTFLLDMPSEARESFFAAFDGKDAGDPKPFFASIAAAAAELGYPCFLRTDHTSGKHGWSDNCFLDREESIPRRVWGIVEYSEMAGIIGLPWDRWAVRELLPTMPVGTCRLYGDMPICREFRFFVDNGEVRCWHPYWPQQALNDGIPEYRGPFDYDAFCRLDPFEAMELSALAEVAGLAVGGSWSIDILETKRGWFVTDMAEADKSFHWDGCDKKLRQ